MKKEKNYYIDLNNPSKILMIGNGISRSFEGDSWRNMIDNTLNRYDSKYTMEEIEALPSNMQIVAASKNHVNDCMSCIARDLKEKELSEKMLNFISEFIIDIPIDTIITTNYTYEVERALDRNYSYHYNNRARRKMVDGTERENQVMLYRYNHVVDTNGKEERYKNIWHIHGEMCTTTTMVMGHYYYGILVGTIRDYIAKNNGYWKDCRNKGRLVKVKSWIDYFLMGDVYVDGFGMDLSEYEFWWLACLKQKAFPDTHIYVFEPNIKKNIQIMANTYGILLMDADKKVSAGEYEEYHRCVFQRMAKMLSR